MSNIKAGNAFVYIEAVDKTAAVLKGVEGKLNSFASKATMIGGGLLAGGATLLAPITGAMARYSDFETILSDLAKTSGASDSELKKIQDKLYAISKNPDNLSMYELVKGVQDLVVQGMELDQAVRSIEAIGKVAKATDSDITSVTKTAFQLQDALEIDPSEMESVFDALAQAGKSGAFELKDIAAYLPTIASSAAALGIKGKKGAVSIGALLQIVRKGAPDASTAANNLVNLLQKVASPDSVKNFKKFGVDIEKVIKTAQKKGDNPLEAVLDEVQRVTGGDPFKVSKIFGDMQVKNALLPLLTFRDTYEKIKNESSEASGVVQADAIKTSKTLKGAYANFLALVDRVTVSIGETLAPTITTVSGYIINLLTVVGDWFDKNKLLIITIAGLGLLLVVTGSALLGFALIVKIAAFTIGSLVIVMQGAVAVAMLLMNPYILLAAAIVGVVAAVIYFSGMYNHVLNLMYHTTRWIFKGIQDTIGKTLEVITNAFLKGDLETAWKAGTLGLEIVWLQFLDNIYTAWDNIVLKIVQSWFKGVADIKAKLLSLKYDVAGMIIDASQNPLLAMLPGMPQLTADEAQAAKNLISQELRKEVGALASDTLSKTGAAKDIMDAAKRDRITKISEKREELKKLGDKVAPQQDMPEIFDPERVLKGGKAEAVGVTPMGKGLTLNEGLYKGSAEAAKKAYENMNREGKVDPLVKLAEKEIEKMDEMIEAVEALDMMGAV